MTDTLRRTDLTPSATEAFDAMEPDLQAAFRRAARNKRVGTDLPRDIGEGWVLVPAKRGVVMVSYRGTRAWAM